MSLKDILLKHGERKVLDGSYSGGSMEHWREQRSKIGDFLQDGTILDFGCANGFLLASLKEWSGKNLDGYGLDLLPENIEQARQLFPDKTKQFLSNDELPRSKDLSEVGWPKTFKNIYWNIWDDFEVASDEGCHYLQSLWNFLEKGGSFVIGSYRSTREENEQRVRELESLGWHVVEKAFMSGERPELVMRVVKSDKGD